MKSLARKKREDSGRAGSPWITTFADLMNLLLCFFVLLFSMSDISEEKFEEISVSFANAFGILEGSGSALDYSQLVSSGMTQVNELQEVFEAMGVNVEGVKNITDGDYNTDVQNNVNEEQGDIVDINDAMNVIASKMEEASKEMYEEVEEMADLKQLTSDIELDIDPNYQFVKISLKGSILFDSGGATLKEEAKPILSKVGDILKEFEGYRVEIEGHTDNRPMTGPTYKDNNWLSSARALNATEYLIKTKDLDPSDIKYSGRGEYDPIASNDTETGRAKNRRIEIKIYNEYSGK